MNTTNLKYNKDMSFDQFLYSNYGASVTVEQRRKAIAQFNSLQKPTFETGATSHAVNDLILFTDNTRDLANSRDIIYNQIRIANIKPKHFHFKDLLTLAVNSYVNTFPGTHWQTTALSENQKREFCQLYVNEFEDWKSEHGYK